MPFDSDLGQCWQSDLSLPKSALTFPHLGFWPSSTAYLRGPGRTVNHALVFQPLKLKEALAGVDSQAQARF